MELTFLKVSRVNSLHAVMVRIDGVSLQQERKKEHCNRLHSSPKKQQQIDFIRRALC